jgi:hypothetical protein
MLVRPLNVPLGMEGIELWLRLIVTTEDMVLKVSLDTEEMELDAKFLCHKV